MARLSARDRSRVLELGAALDGLRFGGPPAIATVLPPLRELLEVERMLAYQPRMLDTGGYELGLLEVAGTDKDTAREARRFREPLARFLARTSGAFGYYDPRRPERAQQNRVVEPTACIPPEVSGALPIAREVWPKVGVVGHRHLRALLCEDDVLLAWFGAIHPAPYDRRQRQLLSAIVPRVRRSLAAERLFGAAERLEATLDVVLETVGAPAFVLAASGRVRLANAAGRAMLDESPRATARALHDAAARRPSTLACDLRPIRGGDAGLGWVAVVRVDTRDGRASARVAEAAMRWGLTARQRRVLELVARGQPTATIAAALGITERAVELHVTRLFDRAGVETRAALVAAVLG